MRMARLELARQSHTPLKRARIPIPPHPHELSNYRIIAQQSKLSQEIFDFPKFTKNLILSIHKFPEVCITG